MYRPGNLCVRIKMILAELNGFESLGGNTWFIAPKRFELSMQSMTILRLKNTPQKQTEKPTKHKQKQHRNKETHTPNTEKDTENTQHTKP